MKCAAIRLREEFHGLEEVRCLPRYLNITMLGRALEIITRSLDEDRLSPRARQALEELLPS